MKNIIYKIIKFVQEQELNTLRFVVYMLVARLCFLEDNKIILLFSMFGAGITFCMQYFREILLEYLKNE